MSWWQTTSHSCCTFTWNRETNTKPTLIGLPWKSFKNNTDLGLAAGFSTTGYVNSKNIIPCRSTCLAICELFPKYKECNVSGWHMTCSPTGICQLPKYYDLCGPCLGTCERYPKYKECNVVWWFGWHVTCSPSGICQLQKVLRHKTCVAHVLGLVRDIPKQRMQCERVTFDLKPLSTQISICHRKNIYDMSIYTSIIYEYIYIYVYLNIFKLWK